MLLKHNVLFYYIISGDPCCADYEKKGNDCVRKLLLNIFIYFYDFFWHPVNDIKFVNMNLVL